MGALSTIVGTVIVVLSMKGCVSGTIGMSELVFRFIIATILLTYGILDLYIEERSICRRLARVKQLENELSKFIE